jgi:hypothetical protein
LVLLKLLTGNIAKQKSESRIWAMWKGSKEKGNNIKEALKTKNLPLL